MGRLVQNHSTNINGLIKWLEKMSKSPEVKTITPASLSQAKGREEKITLKISRKTKEGFKLIARKGKSVQEVFLVTKLQRKDLTDLINNTNPYASLKKKHF